MARQPPIVSERLRAAILAAGVSRYELWKRTGVSQPALSRFIHGKAKLDLEAVDKLADFLGLVLVARQRRGASKRKDGD